MEQRASALQQRLEARRNMFLKSDGNQTYGANRPSGKTKIRQNNWDSVSLFLQLSRALYSLLIWLRISKPPFLLELKCDDQM